ncbi:hypothetical protein Psi02_63850 [Planotetraspora silvatica]|jgi:excisionase family DNA binding protein|uniref:Helix-turn-helix domain-containing protein n=1 Tax=Planotetraspora silvatica TaxID=234614 RepID=A0A8J3USR1_9ACTN|nr:helix-turn-helix domain-containing protein [Planotetraspora silvatica]GII49961.1 hypothetical protein Psi02_63850 [Planotetraspora silvatica]
MDDDRLLTVNEAADRLRVSRWTLYCLIRSGELESLIVGVRCRRVPVDALNNYVTRLREEAA